MNSLNKIWPPIKLFFKKHWLPVVVGSVIISLVGLLLPITRSSWLKFPPKLKARVALEYLAADKAQGAACRDACQMQRQQYQEFLNLGGKELRSKIAGVIMDENTNPEIRNELTNYWQTHNWEAPSYDESTLSIKQKLILAQAWPQSLGTSAWDELVGYFQTSSSEEEKLKVLQVFFKEDSPGVLGLILNILTSHYSYLLKEQAYFLWANLPDKQMALNLMSLAEWREIIDDTQTPSSLKELIIFGVGDYYQLYPEEVIDFLHHIINQTDDFSLSLRQIAVEILENISSLEKP